MAKKSKNKKVKNASTNKEYPIMWLTLGKKDAGNTLRTIDWKTGKEIESDQVFKHNGETVKVSTLNKIFGHPLFPNGIPQFEPLKVVPKFTFGNENHFDPKYYK